MFPTAKKIAHSKKCAYVDLIAVARIADSAVSEAERYVKPAYGHKEQIIVTYKLSHCVIGFV